MANYSSDKNEMKTQGAALDSKDTDRTACGTK